MRRVEAGPTDCDPNIYAQVLRTVNGSQDQALVFFLLFRAQNNMVISGANKHEFRSYRVKQPSSFFRASLSLNNYITFINCPH